MTLDQALARYRERRFADRDVMRCTGLSLRAWRELLRIRALNTTSERRGPGRVRICDDVVFKRAAAIAAVNRAGFSLPVAGAINFFLPYHSLLFTVCDPLTILVKHIAEPHGASGPLQISDRPAVDWFDPDKPATAEPARDWLIGVYDGRFVGVIYGTSEPVIFGELRNGGADFIAWHPSHDREQLRATAIDELTRDILPYHRFDDFILQFETSSHLSRELKSLGYKSERRDAADTLRKVAERAVQSPLVTTSANISLAVRRALRRFLGMNEVAAEEWIEGLRIRRPLRNTGSDRCE